MPAAEVEEDAAKRLGLEAANTGRKIEAVIALRYPEGAGVRVFTGGRGCRREAVLLRADDCGFPS